MKEIDVEKVLTVRKYEATDGTLFDNKDECQIYENTAKCLMLSKYIDLIIKTDTEYNIYGAGSEDYNIDVIKLKSSNDVDLIIRLWILHNQYIGEDYNKINDMHSKLTTAFRRQQFFFIGRGYKNDTYWPLNSLNNVVERIVTFCDDSACIEILDRND